MHVSGLMNSPLQVQEVPVRAQYEFWDAHGSKLRFSFCSNLKTILLALSFLR